ncbi:hypothetical protein Tco_1517435 [Tanacetum coccineum]
MRICCFSRSTAKADLGLSAPNDSIPQQQGIDKGTKSTSFDHISAGTDPHFLLDQTKSISEGLETILTQPITGKGASSIARQVEEDKASRTIKLEVLEKLLSRVQPSFKDLDSPEDDPIIVVDDSDKDEEADKDEVHATTNDETENASSQKHKLELEKNKAEAEAALLRAQPSFPNMGQLNELLVNSLQTEFSKILSAHDFSSSLPTELKEPPSKFNELTKEVKGLKKQVHNLEIQLLGELKEIPTKLEDFTKTVTSLTSQVAELKTLQWELPTEFLSMPTHAEAIASKKTEDASDPLTGKAGTQPAEGEKNINQATISYSLKSSSQPKEEHIKKDKGKKALSSEEAKKESTDIDSDGDETHIEEEAIAEAAKPESEVRKEELVDLLGPEIRSIMDYIQTTEVELGINLDIPLSKQDPLDKLNDLANKKRKHVDDIYDYFKANKRLKSPVQYKDHLAGTVLNEPVLEIFFRRHQGPGLDDHTMTFSSLLLAKVDKRNLNLLKQMRTIKQLRQ